MDELLDQFLIEGPDLVQQGVDALLALEREPKDRSHIDDAFRAVHTLKGSVGLFDLPPMALTLHAAEDVLGAVREDRRAVDRAVIGLLLTTLDQTQAWLEALSGGGLPGDAMARADRLTRELSSDEPAPPAPAAAAAPTPGWVQALADAMPVELASTPLTLLRYEPRADCYFSGDDPLALVAGAPGLAHLKLSLRSGAEADGPYDPFACDLVIEAVSTAPLAEVKTAFRFVPDQIQFAEVAPRAPGFGAPSEERQAEVLGRTLRVDAHRLDALATLIDELITAKTGLATVLTQARAGGRIEDVAESLRVQYGAIDRLLGVTHQRVMALRLAPVRPLLRRFPRVVRELAESLGKDIDLVIEGDGVEADRNVVEGLFEPLTHLLRNAIDHGIESPDGRLRAGKPAKATVVLGAREQAGRLSLTVRDDGRGIDPAAIRAIAARRALVQADTLELMGDAAVIDLIFMPGFSTAEAVTNVSGRGVGMDAIRVAVLRLGGKVSVATQVGVGTSIELLLPLTVSLTKVMVVTHAQERFGVPMNGVLETVRLRADQVIPIRAGHAFNWRDQAVPLLPLSTIMGGAAVEPRGGQRVLVVRSGGQVLGLAIDAIEDRLDVAMRPMDGLLAGMPGLAGTTMLGDGRVLMILDPEALAQ